MNNPPSLLFDNDPPKYRPRRERWSPSATTHVKVTPKDDCSDAYFINEAIRAAVDLPGTYLPPIKTTRINMDAGVSYRVTIYENRPVTNVNGKISGGIYVYKTYHVTKVQDGLVFDPALPEKDSQSETN